ncbi:MAG: NADH-quinone oxidoreductase subunit NuoF [Synergistales bacterium]|nr:NADH-quinone oxidoreductase subunit NuoF [Synergistales bacterium]
MPTYQRQVLICGGTGCVASGSLELQEALKDRLEACGLTDRVLVLQTGCHGICEAGPIVVIHPEGTVYTEVRPEDAAEIVEEHLRRGRHVERLMQRDIHSFYAGQMRLTLQNCGRIDPERIEEYIAYDGYQGLANALFSMTPEEVVEQVALSGLRGRGGGGFPTGKKWEFCARAGGGKKYVICNADEGDPGAFMDRSLLEGDPNAILEGMAIGAYAMGADEGYIYCRTEYPLAVERLHTAIAQAEEYGLLGDNIMGTDFSFHVHIKEGAGAFVCGEETALMASIEGKRGTPRPRPPFPADSGLWGKPTNINNVETWGQIPQIILKGGDWYNAVGTERSRGTKVFALTGKVNNTGLVEVPMGITLREIIFDIGGGIRKGKGFKAVQIGGPSGGCLTEEHLDLPVSYESLSEAGAIMGSGGLVVMDDETCIVDVARFFLEFTQAESCGKCPPCREGTKKMLDILNRITEGEGSPEDIDTLERLAYQIRETSLCGLGQTAPNPVLTTLRYFRDEYMAHIEEKRCPAGVCQALTGYSIDPDRCVGCTKCAQVCPVQAIQGERGTPHSIDRETCIQCGACVKACPVQAISRS